MAYKLSEINAMIKSDPVGFIKSCNAEYERKIIEASDRIEENLGRCPIVLLSGPSGSGKTTTAIKIDHELEKRGIVAHTVSMDNYFRTVDPETVPRTQDGALDFESPQCLDLPLLNTHFDELANGKEIVVPCFDFTVQSRSSCKFTPLRLEKKGVAIFEGIHALNPAITGEHPDAERIYISTRSDILDDGGAVCFMAPWVRLVRRIVRDFKYRGADAMFTLSLWENVKRGETLHIAPYMSTANVTVDTVLPYELSIFKDYFPGLLRNIPDSIPSAEEYRKIVSAFDLFVPLDEKLLPADSLIREFIGGSSYHYSTGVN